MDKPLRMDADAGELMVWEQIAKSYAKTTIDMQLTPNQSKEAFQLLLSRSMRVKKIALAEMTLNYLTTKQAKTIVESYKYNATPLIIIKI